MKRFAPFVVLALLLSGCATIPDVQTDHDPAVDFSHYQT